MRFWVGLTDHSWLAFLAVRNAEEANFWQPSPRRAFRHDEAGLPFLFKLRKEAGGAIVGGGFFVSFSTFPIEVAWELFGESNGAASLYDFRNLVEALRHGAGDSDIGCNILSNTFFLPREDWIEAPSDWPRTGLMRGKFLDTAVPSGAHLWQRVSWHLTELRQADFAAPRTSEIGETPHADRYGEPVLVRPRLGQGAFRALVTDAYQRKCAMTGESTLIALEAAHILPYGRTNGPHDVDNGLLLRADFHKLFDNGLVSVTPDLTIKVSPRIREAWYNGKAYYRLDGKPLEVIPTRREHQPNREYLDWHFTNRFQR